MKNQRVAASAVLKGPDVTEYKGDRNELIDCIHDALYASKICSYAQGMALIRAGSDQYKWGVNLSEVSRIWKGGCIIRAQFLDVIKQAFQRNPDLANLLLDPHFSSWIMNAQSRWRHAVSTAQAHGIPVLAMSASLNYYDLYRTAQLPQNLTQAQRDFFGSHLYQRADEQDGEFVHTDWVAITGMDLNK
jgi:6-phosphogluconate dehydrogenase